MLQSMQQTTHRRCNLDHLQCSYATLLQVPHTIIQMLLLPSQLARHLALELVESTHVISHVIQQHQGRGTTQQGSPGMCPVAGSELTIDNVSLLLNSDGDDSDFGLAAQPTLVA